MDPRSQVVSININNVPIPNTSIDLGETIDVTTKLTMEKLQRSALRATEIVLRQLVDQFIVYSGDVLEDIFISIDSWEYPDHFMILKRKTNLGGYPLMLGRSWLATTNAYISY